MTPQIILDLWFSLVIQPWWFMKSDTFDANICTRSADIWRQVAAGELSLWCASTRGASPKSSSLTNTHVTCIGAARSPSCKTAWRSFSCKKPPNSPIPPLSTCTSANSPCCLMHSEGAAIHNRRGHLRLLHQAAHRQI